MAPALLLPAVDWCRGEFSRTLRYATQTTQINQEGVCEIHSPRSNTPRGLASGVVRRVHVLPRPSPRFSRLTQRFTAHRASMSVPKLRCRKKTPAWAAQPSNLCTTISASAQTMGVAFRNILWRQCACQMFERKSFRLGLPRDSKQDYHEFQQAVQ